MNQNELHKLVSLTFDENPRVRKEAARSLAEIDDPAALFALIELNYDKDPEVRKVAEEVLKKKKSEEREVLSFAEIFDSSGEQQKIEVDEEEKKRRVLSPITKLFEKKLGKEKADVVKSKMMPTIEKIYMKEKRNYDNGRKSIQEFLTSYLEAIESISTTAESEGHLPEKRKDIEKPSMIYRETLPDELEEIEKEDEAMASIFEGYSQSDMRKAYEMMMLSGGDDGIMKREMNRMLREYKRNLKLAFSLAKRRFKETKITELSKIKNGMRNINTESLGIRNVNIIEYHDGKKRIARITVYDEKGGSMPLYLPVERASLLKEGMVIKIMKGYAKRFAFSNEIALTVSRNGSVCIIV